MLSFLEGGGDPENRFNVIHGWAPRHANPKQGIHAFQRYNSHMTEVVGVAISFWNFHVRMNIYHLFGKKKNSEDNFL